MTTPTSAAPCTFPPTMAQALATRAAADGNAATLFYQGVSISCAELEVLARRFATMLSEAGVGRGDRVAIWMPTCPAWLAAMFAAARLGAIVVATNTRFRGLELSDIFNRAGVSAVVWWPDYRDIDFPALLAEVRPQAPQLRSVITYSEAAGGAKFDRTVLAGLREWSWHDLNRYSEYPTDHATPGAPCLMFTTSGTTRKPKLVMHAQSSIVRHALEAAAAMGYRGSRTAAFCALPMAGTFGFTQAMACLLSGAHLVLAHSFDPHEAVRLMQKHHVNIAAMAYEMIIRIFAATDEKVPFPGLSLCTGSHADRLVRLGAERGFSITGVYGSSEVHALFSLRRADDEPVRRALGGGYPVSPQTQVRVTDLESGAVLEHEQTGQIEIHATTITLGYYNDAEANAKAFTADGWFRSGDLGSTSADGSFRYLARLGDSLRLRGFLVSPMEIEAFIAEQPGVEIAQVIGAEGVDGLPCAIAFYKAQEGASVNGDVLRAACVSGMASYKVPARFVAVDAFPVNVGPNTVKIDRNDLRRRAALLMASAPPSSP